MLHVDQHKRVKNVRKAQRQPGEEHEPDQTALLTDGASTSETADLDLLDTITDQGDFDEAVNDWLFDLELKTWHQASSSRRCCYQTPLSCIFGSSIEVLISFYVYVIQSTSSSSVVPPTRVIIMLYPGQQV